MGALTSKRILAVVLGVVLLGSTTSQGADPTGAAPSPSSPTAKRELPWLSTPSGRMRTTLFYGPWQCRREFMTGCQAQCAQEGYPLMGCIWLADIKLEWEGTLVALPIPVKAGSRYGIHHCCCDYPTLSPATKEIARRKWEGFRKSFRKSWSERFGSWPDEEGVSWPGHHLRDLQHGGDPVDPNNLIPAQPRAHDLYNRAYPACYGGRPPWNTVGPDLPYLDP